MVDILLPLYKPSESIFITISSVISQTFVNFRLILINDSKESIDYLSRHFNDPRIIIVDLKDNYGIAHALWVGQNNCLSSFISRIDDGDVWYPNKLSLQMSYLESNPNVVLCGTQAKLISSNNFTITTFPTTDKEIRFKIERARSCLIHTSILFRNFKINYTPDIFGSEDMLLYKQLLNNGKFHIIDECLVDVKISTNGISGSNWHAIMLSHVLLQFGIKPFKNKINNILIFLFYIFHYPVYRFNLLNRNFIFKNLVVNLLSPPHFIWQMVKLFKGFKID